MDLVEAKKIIKSSYAYERYTMLREALDWLIKEAEDFDKVKKDIEIFTNEINKIKE